MKVSLTTKFLLKALVPYSKENMLLAFKPTIFFKELEKTYAIKEKTFRSAFYRAKQLGLIQTEQNKPYLTRQGKLAAKEYKATVLGKGACLMVVFDIPERHRAKRDYFRRLLQELNFRKVQHSVWISSYDHRERLKDEIAELGAQKYIIVYESAKIKI